MSRYSAFDREQKFRLRAAVDFWTPHVIGLSIRTSLPSFNPNLHYAVVCTSSTTASVEKHVLFTETRFAGKL